MEEFRKFFSTLVKSDRVETVELGLNPHLNHAPFLAGFYLDSEGTRIYGSFFWTGIEWKETTGVR